MVNYDLNCRSSTESDESKEQKSTPVEVKFFSGDWGRFTEKYDETYDLILTSETIYSTQNYAKLLQLFDRKLEPSGVVYPFLKSSTFLHDDFLSLLSVF